MWCDRCGNRYGIGELKYPEWLRLCNDCVAELLEQDRDFVQHKAEQLARAREASVPVEPSKRFRFPTRRR